MRGLGTLVEDMATPLSTSSLSTLAYQVQMREQALAEAIRRVETRTAIGILGACASVIALMFMLTRR